MTHPLATKRTFEPVVLNVAFVYGLLQPSKQFPRSELGRVLLICIQS